MWLEQIPGDLFEETAPSAMEDRSPELCVITGVNDDAGPGVPTATSGS
jgi:hypothetical protein